MKYKKLVKLVKELTKRNSNLEDKINLLEYRIYILELEKIKQPFVPSIPNAPIVPVDPWNPPWRPAPPIYYITEK